MAGQAPQATPGVPVSGVGAERDAAPDLTSRMAGAGPRLEMSFSYVKPRPGW